MSGERWGPPPQRRKRPAAANSGRFRIERNSNDDGAQSIPSGRFVKPFGGTVVTADGFRHKPAAPPVKIIRFAPHRNPAGTQLANLDIETPARMRIHSLRLILGPAGTRWIGCPGTWRKGPEREFALDNKGKRIFDPTVDFKDRATREKFLDLVLEALRHARPEMFQHGAGDAG